MKFIVREGIPGSQIDSALPTEFRGRLPAAVVASQKPFTLIVFPGTTHGKVVRSSTLRKALTRVGETVRVVVAAKQFTLEASNELATRDAVVVSVKDLFWTDESLSNSRAK